MKTNSYQSEFPSSMAIPDIKDPSMPPLYLTFVSHNEEPSGDHRSYLENPEYYYANREYVRQLAGTLKAAGACLNFQSDWNFLMAAERYETADVTANTSGKNILQWLVEDMHCSADPHAHETQYNYADVAYLHTRLGVRPSKIVGGFLYDPPDNIQGWEQHEEGIHGVIYPSCFWKADILWGAGTFLHQGNDNHIYGIWRPKNRYSFNEHDQDQRLIYVGCGCPSSYFGTPHTGMKGVFHFLDAHTRNKLPADGFYTASIFIPQGQINEDMIQHIQNDLGAIQPYVERGWVKWATLSDMVRIWQTDYQEKAFRLSCDEIISN